MRRPVGYYTQDQIKVTDWLELLGGLRYDNFTAIAGVCGGQHHDGRTAGQPPHF